MSVWSSTADGLTISGGEPFEQFDALLEILKGWKALSRSDVLIYTGYERQHIEKYLIRSAGLIDAIIVGPYRESEKQTKALRGSDNQSLHILTPSGAKFSSYDRDIRPEDLKLDVLFDKDGTIWFAGIPAQGDFGKLKVELESNGHRMVMAGLSAGQKP